MGLKKNGTSKKVRIMPHESVDSQDSLEMEEFSDEDDEVFVRHNRNDSEEAGKPLIRRKKRVRKKMAFFNKKKKEVFFVFLS